MAVSRLIMASRVYYHTLLLARRAATAALPSFGLRRYYRCSLQRRLIRAMLPR